jgi:iron complex transport system ATP-binding protein
MANQLDARDVYVALGGRDVVRGVSLRASGGRISCILGPNGAGKTTLGKALVGLLPYRGSITLDGIEIGRISHTQRARTIAYVPQRSALDAPLTVATVVGHGRYAHRRTAGESREDRRAIAAAMEATDITHLAARSFIELSGGEQRRVLIARALATGARVMVLDEPAAALDIAHALALYAVLRSLADRGHCIICVMHDLNDAANATDDALLLADGACAAAGATAEILTPGPIRAVYGVELVREPRLGFRLPAP